MSKKRELISVIIPTHNREKKLFRLLKSIEDSITQNDYEIIIVNDASTDGTPEALKKIQKKHLTVINTGKNVLISEARNIGTRHAKGDYLLFLDDDTIVDKKMINNLFFALKNNSNIANIAVCPLMLDFNKKNAIWFAGLKINHWTTTARFLHKNETYKDQFRTSLETDGFVTAFMVNKRIFSQIGESNTRLFPIHFEEIDFCVRAKHYGYKLIVIPQAILFHDHETAPFLNNPKRLYYEVRNRIVIAKLWSKNTTQRLIATLIAVLIPHIYILIKIFRYRKNFILSIKSIYKGIFEGMKLQGTFEAYSERTRENLKNL